MKFRLFFIAVTMLLVSTAAAQKVTNNFIAKFVPLATELKNKWGIPVSIILGVSILESGSGTSLNCRQLNNYFGMTGKNHLKTRRTMYKQYASANDSFEDFCSIVSRKPYYSKLKNNMNYSLWLTSMNHGNYAGAKGVWVTRVGSVIRKHKLQQYDK